MFGARGWSARRRSSKLSDMRCSVTRTASRRPKVCVNTSNPRVSFPQNVKCRREAVPPWKVKHICSECLGDIHTKTVRYTGRDFLSWYFLKCIVCVCYANMISRFPDQIVFEYANVSAVSSDFNIK